MKRNFNRHFAFVFKAKVRLLLLVIFSESRNSMEWKRLSTVILPLLSLIQSKSRTVHFRNYLWQSPFKENGKDYHLSLWLCFYTRRSTDCAEVSPKKTPPSSQVLNELAEGVVRRTGGRLALAFRIFLLSFSTKMCSLCCTDLIRKNALHSSLWYAIYCIHPMNVKYQSD